MRTIPEVPSQVVIDPKQAVMLTPAFEQVLPNAPEYLQATNDAYAEQPLSYLKDSHDSVFTFSSNNSVVQCSLLPSNRPTNEMLIIFAPFSDSEPKSTPSAIHTYMQEGLDNPKKHEAITKKEAAPNSWSQILKSATIRDMLVAAGREMPILTIFSPLPPGVFTSDQKASIKQGDFTPAAELVQQAVHESANRLATNQITNLHFHGMSLGASLAAGAAAGIDVLDTFQIRSATLQELIVGPKNYVPDLAKRFTLSSTVGEESQLAVAPDVQRLGEPTTRQLTDRDGYETAAIGRMLLGMSRRTLLQGLTNPTHNATPRLIRRLVTNQIATLIPLAENSSLTHQTADYLPEEGIDIVSVRAEKGSKATHEIDEHVTLLGLLAVANIIRTIK